jgi:hypothetical protein
MSLETQIMDALLKLGALSPVIILFAWYIIQKDKEIKAKDESMSIVQEARVAEAQAVTDRLLDLSEKWMEAIQKNTEATERVRTVLHAIHDREKRHERTGENQTVR